MAGNAQVNWEGNFTDYLFSWNLAEDKGRLSTTDNKQIWSGSLIPSFWLQIDDQKKFLKPQIDFDQSEVTDDELKLHLKLNSLGTGKLLVNKEEWGLRIRSFSVTWEDEIPEIIEMNIGVSGLTEEQLAMVPDPEKPFAPNWSSFGFCIPGAKEGPAQSYFRSWDFGQSDIALGSFGPSMGTPYGAAFPRPTYMASMGSDNGWITFGAGSVPDAALTLKIRSSKGSYQYLYREDLWGAGKKSRTWHNLLNITFGSTAWTSMRQYVNTLSLDKSVNPNHHLSVWNTWGNWKTGNYTIRPITHFARKTGAEILVLDDPWESFHGAGTYNQQKFPGFNEEIDTIHRYEMEHGIWETLAWVDFPEKLGLTKDDLLLDRNGNPCKGSWNFDPFGPNHFIVDISSENARDYLVSRTKKVIKEVKPRLIKLDFGYGISSPNVGVPRDPNIRGERYCLELTKLISNTVKEMDSTISIMYYGISPFLLPYIDMVSLDDQGDLWLEGGDGHDQWSIWASLISDKKTALNGSSGYSWDDDDEILLNTIIVGSPGSVLPNDYNGKSVPEEMINRRYAVNQWYRRTIQWEPDWLNSSTGSLSESMKLKCWGRVETAENSFTSALVLRDDDGLIRGQLEGFDWTGRWGLISQDDKDITQSRKLAVIPFDQNSSISFPLLSAPKTVKKVDYIKSEKLSDWEWKNGVMTIQVDNISDIAGFIIQTK